MTVAPLTDPAEPVKLLATCPHCGTAAALVNPFWLQWQRKRAGLTLRQLGQQLGISGPYLSDIERGNRRCSPQLRAAYERLEPARCGIDAATTAATTSTSLSTLG